MKIFIRHKWWWLLLIIGTIMVSVITSQQVTAAGLLTSVLGHFIFAIAVAFIPWLFYRLFGKPLTTEQMMATITVGWLILVVANLAVIP